MVALKQSIEQLFQGSWLLSPLHITGFKFDSTGFDEWIKLTVVPLSATRQSVSSNCDKEELSVEIFCYARTMSNSMTLGDEVKKFINDSGINKASAISYSTQAFETNSWMTTVRLVAYDIENIPDYTYLVDSSGNILTDEAGNKLIL